MNVFLTWYITFSKIVKMNNVIIIIYDVLILDTYNKLLLPYNIEHNREKLKANKSYEITKKKQKRKTSILINFM
jgi:hypothetical protein